MDCYFLLTKITGDVVICLQLYLIVAKYYQDLQIKAVDVDGKKASVGDIRNACKILVGNPEGRRLLGSPGLGIYVYIYIYIHARTAASACLRTGYIWLKTGILTSCCEHGDEHSGSVKDEKVDPEAKVKIGRVRHLAVVTPV
jgi:hypothetical protein